MNNNLLNQYPNSNSKMKSITILSPQPLASKTLTGLEIRIKEIKKWFLRRGLKVYLLDSFDEKVIRHSNVVYTPISTNSLSVGHQCISENRYNKPLVIDLYTPILLEKEASFSYFNPLHQYIRFKKQSMVKKMVKYGAHFLLANHRQQNYWLNFIKNCGIDAKTNDFSVIPTGAPRIKVDFLPFLQRKTILWFGGIYPWMNPWPLVDAFSRLAPDYPDWKLRILGGFQLKTGYKVIYRNIIEKAKLLIPGRQLEVIPWQKHKELPNYLKDVAFAVHLPHNSQEDYYAHRVRLLTLLNAGIPIMTSGDDVISDLLIGNKAGIRMSSDFKNIITVLDKTLSNTNRINKLAESTRKVEGYFIKTQTKQDTLLQFMNKLYSIWLFINNSFQFLKSVKCIVVIFCSCFSSFSIILFVEWANCFGNFS